MIRKVQITNFKSVADLELDLGRVNVFIGSNGSGKSNILEAISFASAAEQNKLDHEFLASRGIRVTEPEFMRSAFETGEGAPVKAPIAIVAVGFDGFSEHYVLGSVKGPSYPRWVMLNNYLPSSWKNCDRPGKRSRASRRSSRNLLRNGKGNAL